MPIGPGKYDHLATYVREQTSAEVVFVCVLKEGDSGFSIQAAEGTLDRKQFADVLRMVANQIHGAD